MNLKMKAYVLTLENIDEPIPVNTEILKCRGTRNFQIQHIPIFAEFQKDYYEYLKIVPNLSNLTNLRILDCSFNKLTSLPDLSNLTNLRELNCSGNQTTAFPDLSNLTNLRILDFSFNKLTSLPDLSNLTNLRELNCFGNQITAFPDLSKLVNLKELICSENPLIKKEMDTFYFPSLQEIIYSKLPNSEKRINAYPHFEIIGRNFKNCDICRYKKFISKISIKMDKKFKVPIKTKYCLECK